MSRYFRFINPSSIRKGYRFLLAFLWVLGLLFGIALYHSAGSSLSSLMRRTPLGAVSIFSQLYVGLFPFLITIFVVSFFKPVWLLLICFCKAVAFAFISIGIFDAFGTAGWLIGFLILFSDWISVLLLYFLWLRQLSGQRESLWMEHFLLLSLFLLIGSIDYRIISPFLGRLIDF